MEHGDYHKTPYINYGLIAVNFAFFLYLEAVGSTEDTSTMVRYGALFLPAVLQRGEYWRLLTAMFMHFGIQHIVNNMLILFVLGDNLERALGKVKYLIFYLICGIGANGICLLKNVAGKYDINHTKSIFNDLKKLMNFLPYDYALIISILL